MAKYLAKTYKQLKRWEWKRDVCSCYFYEKKAGQVLGFFVFFLKPSGIRPHKDILTGQSSEI